MVETLCAIAAAEVYEIEVTGQEIKGGRIRLIDIKSLVSGGFFPQDVGLGDFCFDVFLL